LLEDRSKTKFWHDIFLLKYSLYLWSPTCGLRAYIVHSVIPSGPWDSSKGPKSSLDLAGAHASSASAPFFMLSLLWWMKYECIYSGSDKVIVFVIIYCHSHQILGCTTVRDILLGWEGGLHVWECQETADIQTDVQGVESKWDTLCQKSLESC
jgi:hypothetical protein